ncbi:metal-sensitive transcriptional regulator [Trichococcus sp. K1Tr]|uniref:Metal-sensitive transcriptional repressor n=3 Tax=Trichococcus shcherbakoviae TaxID=2094020 RepID=A0A383TBG8_9LACT|nr:MULTISPECIES: metal-sensitive transcriptional regulator [Trichococcus]OUL09939.1 cytoplasmic protein [Sedimentibacter sp. SX930]HEX5350562.1 metal-sensitive transcriptional regulator [Trichococcus sp.]MDB6352934.1 metal-sensitive transcriptional regulator [Trichococcus sp. K1Tr]TNV70190.1 metal-sensitive transcriptional regulator [Trichococcus shcherbakoviae subsp. psychrophilus]SYZ77515.1 metal-sensitive transcriptional repressor [Trichococcus shcherbakoviae]
MNQYNKNIINRIKRAEGQMRGILAMMEDGKNCSDVVTQLSAVRSSIDRAMGIIVAENLVSCVNDQEKDNISKEESVQQAINLLVKSR